MQIAKVPTVVIAAVIKISLRHLNFLGWVDLNLLGALLFRFLGPFCDLAGWEVTLDGVQEYLVSSWSLKPPSSGFSW